MIFKLKPEKNKFIEGVYKKSMKELSKFYELNWVRNKPSIILIDKREEINKLIGRKTEDWLIGWSDKNKVFLLNPRNFEKESSHKYSDEEYSSLVKHELGHSFFFAKTHKASYKPTWLNEGLAIFISGQNKFKTKLEKFERVLDYYENSGKEIYKESGFLIEFLVKKYGKKKLIKLIIELEKVNNKKEFKRLFKRIYGFELNYKNTNKLLK